MNSSIVRMGSMSRLCFGFGMQVLQGWVQGLVCVLVWNVGIARLGPMSSVCFSFWNASITRLGTKFSVSLRLVCGYCRVGSHVQCGFK
jgi:hypothetical protein